MEYPMMTLIGGSRSDRSLFGVTYHEIAHMWFPMIVNSDERQWTWMDEGLNTFLQHYAEIELFPEFPGWWGSPANIREYMRDLDQVPIMTQSDSVLRLGPNAYGKPTVALMILRETILGRELFDFAFREYSRRWRFKRPTPADFFRTMEEASGVDLDWFWRGWIETAARLDHSVEAVWPGDAENPPWIHIRSGGEMIMPVELALTWMNGSVETVRLPVEMWNLGPDFVYRLPAGSGLAAVKLDPRQVYPDDDRSNDGWSR